MAIRKNGVYKSVSNFEIAEGEVVEKGTVLFCIKGGKRPTMAFFSLKDGKVSGFDGSAEYISSLVKEADKKEVPKKLAEAVGLDAEDAPAIKKGAFYKLKEDVTLDDGHTFKQGAVLLCEKGGKSPWFLTKEASGEHVKVSLFPRDVEPSTPIKEVEALADLKANIKTYPAMSEETTALSGVLRIGAMQVIVKNSGTGGSTICQGSDEACQTVERLLEKALRDAGLEIRPGEDLTERYVDYYIYARGIDTFPGYVSTFRAIMDRLMS
ncbi:hypothetical protein [Halomonas sp. I5-271120]|uniref:hypothetical protein n=1 Tax=Halomonas sp. I5-271120 TaxID=3061632 RepID=UPI00271463B3|nr:hypothetical protein [Halomonas sp. I5-271120]